MIRNAGLFISIDGIDGAGKSSHIERLCQWLKDQGLQVINTREPGGTTLGEQLREMILHQPMEALTESLLVFAARREHLVQVILPALEAGKVVVCDRFTDATFAYQGAGRGFNVQTLKTLEDMVQGFESSLIQPDLTLLFEVPAEIAAQRLSAARSPDKFESQSIAFFERVAQAYRQRADADPQRFVCIDGNRPIHMVWDDVLASVALSMENHCKTTRMAKNE